MRLQGCRGSDIYRASRQAADRGHEVGESMPALYRMVQLLVVRKHGGYLFHTHTHNDGRWVHKGGVLQAFSSRGYLLHSVC